MIISFKSKILLTNIDMLLMVQKGIRGKQYQKLITGTWKIMTKITNLNIFNIEM